MGIEVGMDIGIATGIWMRIGMVIRIGPWKGIRIWMRVGTRILILDWKLGIGIGKSLKKGTQ